MPPVPERGKVSESQISNTKFRNKKVLEYKKIVLLYTYILVKRIKTATQNKHLNLQSQEEKGKQTKNKYKNLEFTNTGYKKTNSEDELMCAGFGR